MKIREGFISNSSTTSFVIRGIKFTQPDLKKILNLKTEAEGRELARELDDKMSEFDLDVLMDWDDDNTEIYAGTIIGSTYGAEFKELNTDFDKVDKDLDKMFKKAKILSNGEFKTYIKGDRGG